jgi:hypothetical protein
VSKGAHKVLLFYCEPCDKEFETRTHHVTISNAWCSSCRFKTERKLSKVLKDAGYDIDTQKTFKWCINDKTGKHCRYDVYLPDLNIVSLTLGHENRQYNFTSLSGNLNIYKNILQLLL